jgi:hypothetical protein
MDETEITNKSILDWVKDSTMRMELAKLADGLGMKPEMVRERENGSIGDFAFNDSDPEKMTHDKYMYDNYYSIGTDDDPYSGRRLNKMLS